MEEKRKRDCSIVSSDSWLPLKLSLRDYNATEKIADLPRKLSTKGAPDGIDPSIGDLTYYAPAPRRR